MSAVRARASLLQEESEKMGKNLENGDAESLDEEGMKKVKKVSNSQPLLAVTKTDTVRYWTVTTHSSRILSRSSVR